MEPNELPFIFLLKLRQFLNTSELYNLYLASSESDAVKNASDSNFFRILFDQKYVFLIT
jgi:hypothetical protein